MKLGAFSVSLTVKDIKKSYEFYQKLGFKDMGGDITQNWLILKNGETVIGLFQGMFDKNILTFNPGWDQSAKNIDEFLDVRDIEKHLKKEQVTLIKETEKKEGPDHIILEDPDGNMIMFDQHR